MCGIALIVSGLRIRFLFDSPPPNLDSFTSNGAVLTVEDFKSVLQRRGPDSLSTAKLILQFSQNEPDLLLSSSLHGAVFETPPLDFSSAVAELLFIGSTLQLRGLRPVTQPFRDSSGNILVFNGEIFGGIDVGSDSNDGEVLLQTLESCCSCMLHDDHTSVCSHDSVLDVLSAIRGPWAIVYWQERSKTLWFGRDAFGRRSLLVHWPCLRDSRFMLSSVSPVSSFEQSSELTVENGINTNFWEELPCGLYSLSIDARNAHGHVVGKMQKHEWANQMLVELIKWDRISIEPKNDDLKLPRCKIAMWQPSMQSASLPLETGLDHAPVFLPALNVLTALRKAVMLRSVSQNIFQPVKCSSQEELVPVAVLFSGGLDSMILAALLDQCLDAKYGIDLLNVSFDGQSAPDRISALSGLEELRRIAPARRWKLVEIDADLSKIGLKMKHVTSLINPANTYMDLNIGTALWLASSAEGWVYEGTEHSNDEKPGYIRYKSTARIILVGSGADEQCAGYGRHRTKYRSGSWHALYEEMKLDMQRIWKRNMGRDDRCISDNGKEARFPFLDEDVIKTLLDIPLWEVANLDQPLGTGDKKILRQVAQMLGLCEASALPKRAIQFGSRIARESNRKNFGSNRAANQASAGSVLINMQ